MCGFDITHQLIAFLRRHLAALDHVLNEIACALDGKARDSGGSTDDIFHGRGDLCPGLLTDQLRTFGQLGDRVSHVGAAMAGRTFRRYRSLTVWCGSGSRGAFIGLWLLDHIQVTRRVGVRDSGQGALVAAPVPRLKARPEGRGTGRGSI